MGINSLANEFGILIFVWNCRSLLTNIIEFKRFINQSNPHIICLCETWLKLSDNLKFPEYNIFRKDRFGKGGGVAIMVRRSLQSRNHNNFNYFDGGILETLVIQVQVNNTWADICSIYNPCKNISEAEFLHYFENLSQNAIICGDFNAHHPIWSSNTNIRTRLNPTGSALADVLLNSPHFTLLTPPETPTHFNKQHNLKSTIDLAFGKGIFAFCENVHRDELLGTDHYPITYCFNYSLSKSTKNAPLKWEINNLDWDRWRANLISSFNSTGHECDVIKIIELITEATEKLIKLKSKQIKYKQYKPFWTPECSYYIALRRKAQKKYEKFPTVENKVALNRQTAITKRFLLKKKREKWQEYCSSLDHETPTSRVWKFFKMMNGKPSFDFSYPVLDNGKHVTEDDKIANIFANFYNNIFNKNLVIQNQDRKKTEIYIAAQLNHNADYNKDFNIHELKSVIKSLNEDSAMGKDSIHNAFFTHFPDLLLENLLTAINKSWKSGNIPQIFKHSTLLPILKNGKDPSLVESYRPISLISCFAKLIEKLVFNRLYSYVENKKHLPLFQCGFRKQHSCTDLLVYLEHFIQLSLRTQKVLIIVFFDLEKAFDSASHLQILYNLTQIGIKGRMLKWLTDFFANREFNVRIGNTFSDPKPMSNGVPQGSTLSPLLFSLLQLDIPDLENTHILQYADDLSIFVMENSIDVAVRKIQNSINRINNWYKNIGLNINYNKTNFMVFTRKKLTRLPTLTLNNTDIQFVTSTKFLGINLDGPFLTWKNHVKYLINSSAQKLNIMKSLSSTKWGAHRNLMNTFYQAYIKSKFLYGIQVYSSASPTILSKLEIVQNSAIRIITGLRKSTPITTIHFESNLYPINTIHQMYTIKYLYKVLSLPKDHIIHKLFSNQLADVNAIAWNTLSHKSPLLKRALNICNRYSLPLDNIVNDDFKFNRFIPPPWFSMENIVSTVFVQTKKEDINNEQAIQTYNFIKQTNYETFSKIYTDGSKQNNETVGSAIYVDDISSTFSWKLNSQHTIVTAELFAIYQAINFAHKNLKKQNIVIFSDSLSALLMIKNYQQNQLNFLVNLIVQQIYDFSIQSIDIALQWIPSHRGIVGNNIADQVAKDACSYHVITKLPLVLSDSTHLLQKKIYTNKLDYWQNIKTNIEFSKSVTDIANWVWLSLNNRSYDVLLARLRSGCTNLNDHLHKIKMKDSPNCNFCTNKKETVEHFIFECTEYISFRTALFNDLGNLNINQDEISLKLLLTGGEGSNKLKMKILRLFIKYVKLTKRFEI